jgi:hypothetical protein
VFHAVDPGLDFVVACGKVGKPPGRKRWFIGHVTASGPFGAHRSLCRKCFLAIQQMSRGAGSRAERRMMGALRKVVLEIEREEADKEMRRK